MIEIAPPLPDPRFRCREVPIGLLGVPRPERCACLSFWRCEHRAVVKVDCFQFCAVCYLAYVRTAMEVYSQHVHDEEY